MATSTRQEVDVKKPQTPQTAAPNLWMRPYEEFERFLDRLMVRNWPAPFNWEAPVWGDLMAPMDARIPSIDVLDRDDHLLVRAEVPGVNKDDLDVSISDDVLTIKGETKREDKQETGNYFRHEISRTAFARSVTLPVAVDADKISAALTDGVLEVTIGKAEAAKRRNVEVK